MSTNSELGAMHTATTIVHELNEGHAAKSSAEKTQASNELRESFNQLLGPSVNHASRDQIFKDVFKIDPAAEAKIHELLPDLQFVHDRNGQVNIDKTVTQLENEAAHPVPAPDEQVNTPAWWGRDKTANIAFDSYEKTNLPMAPAEGKSADIAFEPYEHTNLPIAPATGTSPDIAFKTYEHTNLPIAPTGEIVGKDGSVRAGDLTFAPHDNINLHPAPGKTVDFDLGSLRRYLSSQGLNSGQIDDLILPPSPAGFATHDNMSRPNSSAHFDNMVRTPPSAAVETHDHDQVDLVPEAHDNE
jgi:hypothetical protein